MIEFYKRLRDQILKDIDEKLKGPANERSAEKLKKELDIAADCEVIINSNDIEDAWSDLSLEAQAEITDIIEREKRDKKI